MINLEQFQRCSQDVIDLNLFVRDKHDYGEVMLENQRGYMLSELQELKDALQAKDVVATADAIADVFVTGIYFAYLYRKGSVGYRHINEYKSFDYQMNFDYMTTQFEQTLFDWVKVMGDDATKVLNEVHQSNMSKFPLVGMVDVDKNIKTLSEKVNAPVYTKTKQGRLIFLNEKTNKFLKPDSFIEPDLQFILDNKEFVKFVQTFPTNNILI